jgi:hypothetical protein
MKASGQLDVATADSLINDQRVVLNAMVDEAKLIATNVLWQCGVGQIGRWVEQHLHAFGPDQSTGECMSLMTTKRLRHLPVTENDVLLGIVSIGDLVKSIIIDREFVIEQLAHYISGSAR